VELVHICLRGLPVDAATHQFCHQIFQLLQETFLLAASASLPAGDPGAWYACLLDVPAQHAVSWNHGSFSPMAAEHDYRPVKYSNPASFPEFFVWILD
jgi:hypothetical protein